MIPYGFSEFHNKADSLVILSIPAKELLSWITAHSQSFLSIWIFLVRDGMFGNLNMIFS